MKSEKKTVKSSENKVEKKSPLPKDAYLKNAGVYKVLANSKRLEILNILNSLKKLTYSKNPNDLVHFLKKVAPNLQN
jgi:hypothetical protein